jgi:Fe-S cluster biosynthesis and repair protein YggX
MTKYCLISRPSWQTQQTIIANQKRIEANQAKLDQTLSNQATIISNQETILSNQKKLNQVISNQEHLLANQKEILSRVGK